MRPATILFLSLTAMAHAGCGGGGGDHGGGDLVPVDISHLDPSVEAYTGSNSQYLAENGLVLRIVASATSVHDGSVSVRFQDVETQEIRFPNDSHPTMIPLMPGSTCVFHAWSLGIDVGGGASVNDVQIELFAGFYSGATYVGDSQPTPTRLSSLGGWEMVGFAFEVPTAVDRCYISMRATAAPAFNVDLYLDDFSIDRTDS